MTSLERRLGRVETAARKRLVRVGMIAIGARLAAGDEAMCQALDRLGATSGEADGLLALEAVWELLDQGERDPAVLEHLNQMLEQVRRMTDEELLDFIGRRGR